MYRAEKCHMMIGVVELQSGNAPEFGMLHDIIIYDKEPSILFVFVVMETLGYDPIMGAYVICPLTEYRCIYRSSILCHHLFNVVYHNNQRTKYIKSKYDLSVYCHYNNM